MKKTYYNPNLTILAIQSLGVICGVSGEGGSPETNPSGQSIIPGGGNAAPRKTV